MRHGTLALLGLTTLLTTAACSHKTPVAAAKPPDTTPVAEAPRSTPAAPRSSGTPSSPSQPVAGTLPPLVGDTLHDRLARLEDAMFDFNKSVIRSDAQNALKDDVAVIREILANYPNQKLLVEGHCDERGSDEYNMALGDQRAHSAEEFLVTMGIPNAQLTLISYGKDRPVCTDSTEACWQRNRRAHLTAAP
jgi:peptidoglycan-associated lipoprotein